MPATTITIPLASAGASVQANALRIIEHRVGQTLGYRSPNVERVYNGNVLESAQVTFSADTPIEDIRSFQRAIADVTARTDSGLSADPQVGHSFNPTVDTDLQSRKFSA